MPASIALVTALSSRLDQAVSIDNGVMHMMGLADIPMIVLFGPTNSEKFAPKNNLFGHKNIVRLVLITKCLATLG